ncbi:putative myosin light chain kinase [Porphyridium purpureum]|uniref:Putative myosin light chain kinase n=1 Tax=Porphyridium purpureum TaxID=35688 RepID=A0A5J4YQJ7_PORPP|nr:putative myosin light chain kinase [Porphyridium purpureum]|eukprot:POR0555..scf222_8
MAGRGTVVQENNCLDVMASIPKGRTVRHGPHSTVGQVKHEGFLLKAGSSFKAMKHKRWMELDGTRLRNYLTKPASPSDLPTWEVSLLNCTVDKGSGKKEIVITLKDKKLNLFTEKESERDEWIDAISRASNMYVEHFYNLGDVLGKGAFGVVRAATNKNTGERVAIKTFKKKNLNEDDYTYLKREIDIVTKVDHPNVVNTYDVFESQDSIFIVMEYLGGGMLYDVLVKEGSVTEDRAAMVMREIVSGVVYLHEKGIVHRDLKPENMLCKQKLFPWTVKLCDFGLANFADTGHMMETQVGTPYFAAPEIIKGEQYNSSVDMWSCGVIMYNILSGKLPFDDEKSAEVVFRKIKTADFAFPDEQWADISDIAKDLIKKLLTVDQDARLTGPQALEHPWLRPGTHRSTQMIRNDLSRLTMSLRTTRTSVQH